MTYTVKEIFYTLQGEGQRAGRPAVFCRFAGCNLWSGREEDRASAVCQFCDTVFVGSDGTLGGKFNTAQALTEQVAALWPELGARGAATLVKALRRMGLLGPDGALTAAGARCRDTAQHTVGVPGITLVAGTETLRKVDLVAVARLDISLYLFERVPVLPGSDVRYKIAGQPESGPCSLAGP